MLICFRSCFFSSFLLLLTLKLYIPKRPTERTTQHSQAQTHQRSHAYFCTAVDEVSRSQSTSLSRRHLGGRPDPSPPQPTVKPFCCHRRPRPQPALPPRQQPLHQQPYPTLSKPPGEREGERAERPLIVQEPAHLDSSLKSFCSSLNRSALNWLPLNASGADSRRKRSWRFCGGRWSGDSEKPPADFFPSSKAMRSSS